MQTYLTQHIARQVSNNLNAKFEVGRVDIVFFNRFILRDIHIEDQQGDTLIKAGRLIATVQYLNRSRKSIVFNQIILHDAGINIRSDADSVINLQFIIDALSSDDPARTRWNFSVNSVHLRNSEFSYKKHDPGVRDYGINFDHIRITRLNLLANRIRTEDGSLNFNIRYLNFSEGSGFLLNHLTSENSVSASGLNISNLQVVTPGSRLDLEYLNMDYSGFDAFRDFVSRVSLDSRFNPSALRFSDISWFAPGLKDMDLEVLISGEISGKIDNLKGSNLNIRTLDETSLLADLNMIGLPDFAETFIFLDIQDFLSSGSDIMKYAGQFPGPDGNGIVTDLSVLGRLSYRGKFTGFIDDFVSYGELRTDLGTLITDLALQPDAQNLLGFNGRLRAVSFDAGTLARSEQVGRTSFNLALNGTFSPGSGINADMEGVIDSIYVLEYNYRHIDLSGTLADRKFEGSAGIDDPNIILKFLGSIDLSKEIPVFDFSANVSKARLYDLKFEKEDPSLTLSFLTTANFAGNNIDNLTGNINLKSAFFEKEGLDFDINDLNLEASGSGDDRKLSLSSDLAEAGISGNFQFETLQSSFDKFINNYVPSYEGQGKTTAAPVGNNFSFSIHLKDISTFTEFFIPELYIAPDTRVEGTFNPSGYASGIKGSLRELRYKNNILRNISFYGHSVDSVFTVLSNAEHAIAGNRFMIENLTLNSRIFNDSIMFEALWDNREKVAYKGRLHAAANFNKLPGKQKPLVDIEILPSSIIIADSLWQIAGSRIIIDSTALRVDNFVFSHENQSLKIDGRVSSYAHDSLHLEFHNMDLTNIEFLTSLEKFELSGTLTGSASLSDLHNNPVFKTDLVIRKLFLNRQEFGDMSIISQWDNPAGSILINAFSDRGSDRVIDIAGSYIPETGSLDFDLELSKVNLRTFDGYLDMVFADLRGIATGKLMLEGTLRQPLINGSLNLQKVSFMVDYLKTRYNFTHDVTIDNNNIVFNNLVLFDPNHNTCRASGLVSSNYFRDFSLDVYLYPERFMALNTTERDNEMFYGRVNASGLIHISGPVKNIMMNISARTERNTQFFIPLQKSSEVGELHFLNFVSSREGVEDDETIDDIRRYSVDLSGLQLNFDLEVTPDAEVQIIFDSKIGDIIRGRGNGSFKMEINTLGRFNMFGEYIIEQGDYLFTLQNVINKRFDIERGGRIVWNGDPFDANVDIKAVYRLRAPLNTLMAPFSNGTNDIYSRRIPVECQIFMRNKLMTPEISFDIDLPTADPDTRRNVQGILHNEEKRNRQFLSLLIINNFLPEQDMAGPGMGSSLSISATEASITTVSEFFSNQLSNWLSQLSRDVDFGVNWRPGDEITPDEVELALSTQVLNDRVSINGHVDVGGRQTNTSNIVGDFDVDIKLNRSGKLRLKAFTRANDNLIRPHLSPYTQGVGLFYREEFNNLDELMNRYWNMVFSGGNEKNE